MIDIVKLLREQLRMHEEAAQKLRAVIVEFEGGDVEPKANSFDLTLDDWRALCAQHGIRCSVNGEVDAKGFCDLNNVDGWQLKRWIADGIVEPVKRGSGRKNYFTVREFNVLRSRKEHNGLDGAAETAATFTPSKEPAP